MIRFVPKDRVEEAKSDEKEAYHKGFAMEDGPKNKGKWSGPNARARRAVRDQRAGMSQEERQAAHRARRGVKKVKDSTELDRVGDALTEGLFSMFSRRPDSEMKPFKFGGQVRRDRMQLRDLMRSKGDTFGGNFKRGAKAVLGKVAQRMAPSPRDPGLSIKPRPSSYFDGEQGISSKNRYIEPNKDRFKGPRAHAGSANFGPRDTNRAAFGTGGSFKQGPISPDELANAKENARKTRFRRYDTQNNLEGATRTPVGRFLRKIKKGASSLVGRMGLPRFRPDRGLATHTPVQQESINLTPLETMGLALVESLDYLLERNKENKAKKAAWAEEEGKKAWAASSGETERERNAARMGGKKGQKEGVKASYRASARQAGRNSTKVDAFTKAQAERRASHKPMLQRVAGATAALKDAKKDRPKLP